MTALIQSTSSVQMNEVLVCLQHANKRSDKVHSFSMPRNATIADLHKAVRSTLRLNSLTPLALTINEYSPSSNATIGDIYDLCGQGLEELNVSYMTEKNMGSNCLIGWGASSNFSPVPRSNPSS